MESRFIEKDGYSYPKINKLPRGNPLHATDLDAKSIVDFLQRIAQTEGLTLAVGILDKQWIWNPTKGRDYLYNQLFAHLIQQTISVQSNMADLPIAQLEKQTLIVLERRDSYKKYKAGLIAEIQKHTSLEESQIELRDKNDIQWGESLQVADSIAWSTYQKYERQNGNFFEIVKDKIKLELMLGIDGRGIMRPIFEMNNEKNGNR